MEQFDVVIIGASFSGLSLAHNLPKDLKILVVDCKLESGSSVESTGLITEHTRKRFEDFFDINSYITNSIKTICVVAPCFKKHFFSHTPDPWIYQTDTKALIRALADTLSDNITVEHGTAFVDVDDHENVKEIRFLKNGNKYSVGTRVLVGADGGNSKVASVIPSLDVNKKFLFGCEKVFFGDVHVGDMPEETIYHFWFGDFSLGYGGWLSSTVIDGKKSFRIGLAKLAKDRGEANELLRKFTEELLKRKMVTIEGDVKNPYLFFGSHIPMGGTLKNIYSNNVLLIGDAAGFCGAFAADGIKGSVLSAKEGAKIISEYLKGDKFAFGRLLSAMNQHNALIKYYKKQVRYRWLWNQMKRNRTFDAMYDIIAAEKEHFLEQFCDSKDRQKSLTRAVLKIKHIPKLIKYGFYVLLDMFT